MSPVANFTRLAGVSASPAVGVIGVEIDALTSAGARIGANDASAAAVETLAPDAGRSVAIDAGTDAASARIGQSVHATGVAEVGGGSATDKATGATAAHLALIANGPAGPQWFGSVSRSTQSLPQVKGSVPTPQRHDPATHALPAPVVSAHQHRPESSSGTLPHGPATLLSPFVEFVRRHCGGRRERNEVYLDRTVRAAFLLVAPGA
ncbi:MAG: hypothetical protein ACYC6C_12615 [Coriobacteriia bacterium]